jgi:hypothetical protein
MVGCERSRSEVLYELSRPAGKGINRMEQFNKVHVRMEVFTSKVFIFSPARCASHLHCELRLRASDSWREPAAADCGNKWPNLFRCCPSARAGVAADADAAAEIWLALILLSETTMVKWMRIRRNDILGFEQQQGPGSMRLF